MSFWRKKDEPASLPPGAAPPAAPMHKPPVVPVATPPTPPTAAPPGAQGAATQLSGDAQGGLSPEELRRAAGASKAAMAAFGEIVAVLMRASGYRHVALAELESLVIPAVVTGQFWVAEAQSKSNGMMVPIGALLWASVSPEVDQRLTAETNGPARLAPAEWKSGNIVWLIDAVGEPQMVQAMLKRMMEKDWQGRPIKTKVRQKDGSFRAGTLAAQPQAPKGA